MIEYIVFGIIDNAVMLSGALFGISVEKRFPKKLQNGFLGATVGAGLGNTFSDFLGGIGATNMELAFGSAIGCILALIIIPIYTIIKHYDKKNYKNN